MMVESQTEFMNIHFTGRAALDSRYLATNIFNTSMKVAMVQDYSHNLKKSEVLFSGISSKHTAWWPANCLGPMGSGS